MVTLISVMFLLLRWLLYNKVNQYTYVDQKINATGELVPIGGMKEPFEDDNWTKPRCYEIVESSCSNDSVVGI